MKARDITLIISAVLFFILICFDSPWISLLGIVQLAIIGLATGAFGENETQREK